MTGAVLTRLLLIGSTIFALEGCGSTTTQPDPRIPPAVGPPTSMLISQWHFGAETSTARVTATWGYLYSTSRDVTAEALWTSSAPGIMAVTGPGQLTAVSPGDAEVRATFNGTSVVQTVRVYPGEGPLLVFQCANPTSCEFSASVRDPTRSSQSNFIEGATVAITGGHNAGRSAVTDGNGLFHFFSPIVCGPIELRASKPGYRDAIGSGVMCETNVPPLLLVPETN